MSEHQSNKHHIRYSLIVLISLGWIYLLMHAYEDESQFSQETHSENAVSATLYGNETVQLKTHSSDENRKVASYLTDNSPSPNIHKTEGGFFYQGELKVAGNRKGPLTNEKTFLQYFNGLQVHPNGVLTQKWSKSGEFVEEYANLSNKFEIVNQKKLSETDVSKRLNSPKAMQTILWVVDGKGYYAYSVESDYHRVIIDAQSGDTLDKKDLRIH